ncbi:MAG: glycosyltransferase family 2 protein [bacterium]
MDLTIIIVNYNMKGLVSECLASLGKLQSEVSFEVIFIDNTSSDGSVDAVRQAFPWVSVIANTENAGFAKACNQGVALAQGDYILFLNPDTEMPQGALDSMIDFFVKNPKAGIIGCRTLNADGSEEPSVYRYPTLARTFIDTFYLGKLLGGYEVKPGAITRDTEVEVICGACLLIRRSVIDQVGSFDEEFWMYGEDVELCYRAARAGWKIFYLYSCAIIHKRGQRHLGEDAYHDLARISYNHYKWIFHYYNRHCAAPGRLALRLMMAAQIYPKLWSRRRKLARGDNSKNNTERLEGLSRVYNEFILGRKQTDAY